MRWLVTGGAGFTGKHLIAALRARGDEVASLGRAPGEDVRCDLTDPGAVAEALRLARPDRVIHLAAVSSVVHAKPDNFFRINVEGTENLLRACAALTSPPQVALASSSNVYGVHTSLVSENSQTMPVSDYGRSKLAMESSAAGWAARLPILIARPFNYTGPGQSEHFLVAKIAAHFRARAPRIELGDIEVLRDFSDVRDIVEDYLLLFDNWPGSGEIVNLCSGRAASIAFIINELTELSGHRLQIDQNPALLRRQEIPVLVGDPSKLIRITKRSRRRPLTETLSSMLAP